VRTLATHPSKKFSHIKIYLFLYHETMTKGNRSLKRLRRSRKSSFIASRNVSRPSEGWRKSSPKLISQRRKLMRRCGSRCFMMPSQLKFPVCSKKNDCRISCAGLASAMIRSGQYKYPGVEKRAKKMFYRYCSVRA
jgi:hypothetical protein